MRKFFILIVLLILLISPPAFTLVGAQPNIIEPDVEGIQYLLYISDDATEYLDDLFQKFSDGYVDPDKALEKVSLLRHEYNKLVNPVPKEGEKLHELMNRLLSRVEYYFIHYKRMDRENPLINFQIAQARYEYLQEEHRLRYLYK
ncbi:hypothetical protein ACFL5E_00780 [Candidatus Omnitrophota bacterium]